MYPRERFGRDMAGRAARASDAHEKVAETVVERLDVGQHAHEAHGAHGGRWRPCSCERGAPLGIQWASSGYAPGGTGPRRTVYSHAEYESSRRLRHSSAIEQSTSQTRKRLSSSDHSAFLELGSS